MAIRYRIDPETTFVVVALDGEMTGAEMLACARALLKDAAFTPGAPLLIDMTTLAKMNANARDFLSLGELQTRFVAENLQRSRLAILAPSDLGYAFGNMYRGFSDDEAQESTRLCSDAAEAAEWLDVPFATVRDTIAAAKSALSEAR
jgi:hypothetical protein